MQVIGDGRDAAELHAREARELNPIEGSDSLPLHVLLDLLPGDHDTDAMAVQVRGLPQLMSRCSWQEKGATTLAF